MPEFFTKITFAKGKTPQTRLKCDPIQKINVEIRFKGNHPFI